MGKHATAVNSPTLTPRMLGKFGERKVKPKPETGVARSARTKQMRMRALDSWEQMVGILVRIVSAGRGEALCCRAQAAVCGRCIARAAGAVGGTGEVPVECRPAVGKRRAGIAYDGRGIR